MGQVGRRVAIPEALRRLVSLAVTIAAAILYALVLGSAVVRTILAGDPSFSAGAVRAASLLSGLVGSVVSAGFAGSGKGNMAPMEGTHTASNPRKPSLAKRNLHSLARTLGFLPLSATPPGATSRDPADGSPDLSQEASLAVWIALLYFAVYFIVGAGCIVLVIIRDTVPDLIGNAAWVCMGTILSSAYAFFALDAER